jgi:hypothetical protein
MFDGLHGGFGQGFGEIDAADFRAAGRRQRGNRDVEDVLHRAAFRFGPI